MQKKQTGQQLALLTVLFALLVHMPLIGIFNLRRLWHGIPVLFLYIFLVWIGIIGLTAWLVTKREKN